MAGKNAMRSGFASWSMGHDGRGRRAMLVALAAMAWLGAPLARAQDGSGSAGQSADLESFRMDAKADEHNAAVTAEERAAPKPARGGELRIRASAFPAGLNRHIEDHNTADQTQINSYVFNDLLRIDPETLEYQPLLAKYWTVQDVLDLVPAGVAEADDTRYDHLYGRIVSVEDGVKVVFLEGAFQATLAIFECQPALELGIGRSVEGKVALDTGEEFEGTITREGRCTYHVEHTAKAKRIEVPWAQLAQRSWKLGDGTGARPRPGVRPHCRYDFFLRRGVTWHDGKPFSANDILFTYQWIVANPHVPAAQLRSNYIDLATVEQLGEHAVRFDWKKPFFKSLDMSGGLSIVAKHRYYKPEYEGDMATFGKDYARHADNEGTVGMGPYRFVKWDKNDALVLERYDDWFACKVGFPYIDKQQPYLDRISWIKIENLQAVPKAMEADKADADLETEPDSWISPDTNSDSFKSKFVRAKWDSPSYTYVGWNLRDERFKDPRVRRALTMLLDRKGLAEDIHLGLAELVSGPFYPYSPSCDRSIPPWPYDPAKAIELLAEAGIADLDGDRKLDYIDAEGNTKQFKFKYAHHNAREYHSRVAVKMKEMLATAGIEVEIQSLDWAIFGPTVRERKFDSFRFAWTAEIDPDPYQIWHSSQADDGSNYVGFKSAEVDRMLEEARITFDRQKRWGMMKKMHRIFHEEQPYSFMFLFKSLAYYRNKYRGVKFYTSRWDSTDLTEWYVAPGAR